MELSCAATKGYPRMRMPLNSYAYRRGFENFVAVETTKAESGLLMLPKVNPGRHRGDPTTGSFRPAYCTMVT
jgi:hypothetical protein